jgi:small multidrug resistance pump
VNRWTLLAGADRHRGHRHASRCAAPRPSWLYAVTLAGEVTSSYLLVKVLQAGMPLGVAYGVWSALGVAATALSATLLSTRRSPA